VAELDERNWPGRCLRIGDVVLGLDSLRGRCVMTTFDPDTLKQDLQVLRSIVDRFGGTLALNASVVWGGRVRQGDVVELLEQRDQPSEAWTIRARRAWTTRAGCQRQKHRTRLRGGNVERDVCHAASGRMTSPSRRAISRMALDRS
jgi:hypothetical protein